MTRMNEVLAIDEDALTVTVEAGISFTRLESAIGGKGYRILIFPESGRTATVGGHIETWGTSPYSSSGFEDQATQIVALKVVLPTGEVVPTGSGAVKGAAGNFARRFFPADFTALFIGAEGAFGVITEVTLKMHRWPEAMVSRFIGFQNLSDAVRVLREFQETQRKGGLLTVSEQRLLPRETLIAVLPGIKERITPDMAFFLSIRGDGDAVDVRHQLAKAGDVAASQGGTVIEDEFPEWWEGRYQLISSALRGPRIMLVAMVPMGKFVEASDLAEKLGKEHGLKITMRGYPMSGPIMLAHAPIAVAGPTASERKKALTLARKVMEAIMDLGGVPHRVGTDFLPVITKRLDPSYYDLIKRIKKMLDPKGIMNPGLVIP
jgi:FAD/FMN-containing dehydrogenase